MQLIKIKCPAKINLSLEITGVRPDGFHSIESIMQTISLYDYLTIKKTEENIVLSGNSNEIPYDSKNLVYKAATLFFEKTQINCGIDIYIEKNIPISAGLAGGSTDAAGTLYGLNILFNSPLNQEELHALASKLGSDLNFCLEGGTKLTSGRGEILIDQTYTHHDIVIVKPKNIGISAREAYELYDKLEPKPQKQGELFNALEYAVLSKYTSLKPLKDLGLTMTGSGSAFFALKPTINFNDKNYQIFQNLETVENGVKTIN